MHGEPSRPGAPAPLIGPHDPPPFTWLNDEGRARVLLVCDHASRAVPRGMAQLGLADWVFERHVAWDIGAAALTRALARRLDAPAILHGYSRLIVDPNRRLDDPSAFPATSDGIAVPANLDLDADERLRRVASFFTPYHDAIAGRLDRLAARGITPVLIAVHTCTPVFAEVVRPWHVGVLWDRDPRVAMPLIAGLMARPDLSVGDNEPYSGRDPHDYTMDTHAERRGLPYAGLEVRQDLLPTEEDAERWAAILTGVLTPILADEALYRPWTDSGVSDAGPAARPPRPPGRDR
ncbi:MAG: N-formylglutamate amidohydrolase [Acidimicrobiia bacterium]|nr:N-formylglutamate amidohydrolase [Acidimicrobiia bacterium]